MFLIYHIKEKEVRRKREMSEKKFPFQKQTLGCQENKLDIIDSEICLQGMKK
jgi:hypothetical protein